jgi:TetR/AcrR family transcriptional regulator, transcriptional repressor for nem operon
MFGDMEARLAKPAARPRLLEAALHAIRAQGYAATSVDAICERAGVSKGSFFHHFRSKDELALAAVAHFSAMAEGLFEAAPYHQAADPLDRLLGYVDFRVHLLEGELAEYTCLLGTLAQETYDTHPPIRAACERELAVHIAGLLPDIVEARRRYAPGADWSAESLGVFIQSVLQGAFIFAKARQGPESARESLAHLRTYLTLLLPRPAARRAAPIARRRAKD